MWPQDPTPNEWQLEQWMSAWERTFELAEKQRVKRARDLKQYIKRKRGQDERDRTDPRGAGPDRAAGDEPGESD